MELDPTIDARRLDTLAMNYLEAVFSADSVLGEGSVVDAYFGHDRITGRFEASQLSAAVDEIICDLTPYLSTEYRSRARDMLANLRAINISLDLKGKIGSIDYGHSLERLLNGYNLAVSTIKNSREKLQIELEMLLSRTGHTDVWPKSIATWNEANAIDASGYVDEMEKATSELEDITFRTIVDPVVGQADSRAIRSKASISFELVDEVGWAANHAYNGNYSSVIEINRQRSFNRHEAFVFASHEVYPGHHISAILREWLFNANQLGCESVVTLLTMPSALLNEGVAECSRTLLPIDLTLDQRIAIAFDQYLTDLRHELVYLVNIGDIEQEEAIGELIRLTGLTASRSRQMIDFGINWRYYAPAYTIGRHLVYDHLKAEPLPASASDLKALFTSSSLDSVLSKD